MAVHAETVEVEARVDLTLWVRRGEAGSVGDGVRDRLDGVDGVTDAGVVDISGVRPLSNELRVDVTADLTVTVEVSVESRPTAVEEVVADGFGVTDVDSVALDH